MARSPQVTTPQTVWCERCQRFHVVLPPNYYRDAARAKLTASFVEEMDARALAMLLESSKP